MDSEVKVCFSLYQDVLCKMRHMFDLTEKRPAYWGPLEASSLRSAAERELTDRQTWESHEGGSVIQLTDSIPRAQRPNKPTTIPILPMFYNCPI